MYIQNGAVNKYTGQTVIPRRNVLHEELELLRRDLRRACDLRTYQSSPAQGWDPNTSLICFVAKGIGTGGLISPGSSAQFVSSTLQGAVYANRDIDIGTTSNVDGPMVGSR